jgi:hypothetical protein
MLFLTVSPQFYSLNRVYSIDIINRCFQAFSCAFLSFSFYSLWVVWYLFSSCLILSFILSLSSPNAIILSKHTLNWFPVLVISLKFEILPNLLTVFSTSLRSSLDSRWLMSCYTFCWASYYKGSSMLTGFANSLMGVMRARCWSWE